jgi:hypothetical protein
VFVASLDRPMHVSGVRYLLVSALAIVLVVSSSCAVFGKCSDNEVSHCDGSEAVTCRTPYSNGEMGFSGGDDRETEECKGRGCHVECTCTYTDDTERLRNVDIAVCGPAPATPKQCDC